MKARLHLAGTLALGAAVGTGLALAAQMPVPAPLARPTLPLPEEALEPWTEERGFGALQIAFETEEGYPSTAVRDFYTEWARDQGWEALPVTHDFVTEGWQPTRDIDGSDVQGSMAMWHDPTGQWSLVLAIQHRGGNDQAEAFLLLAPRERLAQQLALE